MSETMNSPIIPSTPSSAVLVLCLFLAQNGEPHNELGFSTVTAAFEGIGRLFGKPANTIKNMRDRFDRFTDSVRVGWDNEALTPRYKTIFDDYNDLPRNEFSQVCKTILSTRWPADECRREKMCETGAKSSSIDFARKVAANFQIDRFEIASENFATTWTVRNGRGRTFKLSNNDLLNALQEILSAWDDWIELKLNVNSENPDDTLIEFANKHFSPGAHQVLANDQRRGFLHFISSVAYAGRHDGKFNPTTSQTPLQKEDYEAALTFVSMMQDVAEDFEVAVQMQAEATSLTSSKTGGENVIFYGAPGTGKSNRIEQMIKDSKHNTVRTVFHPDLQNSDFFGCLKPQMHGNEVRYGFSPGPFMNALAKAYILPDEMVFLVIEELNRAVAAAVFGELFLLLDRDDAGQGEYDVSFPSEESRNWFQEKTGQDVTSLRIPSNLSIYATMNSADQGVYPLDTAFRRRWKQEYIPLEYESGPDGDVGFVDSHNQLREIAWRDFVRLINTRLIQSRDLALSEDRLLGQWFVRSSEVNENSIPEKVLLYLWDDLLRHGGREVIFDTHSISTYGSLVKASKEKKPFFSPEFLKELEASAKSTPDILDT